MNRSGFEPIDQIHLGFHAYHAVAHDHTQKVESYHFCAGGGEDGVFQCLIYNSPEKNAKLIGIEYLIPEEMFKTLPDDEKPLWHSHKHEVASGLLLPLAPSMAGSASDAAKSVLPSWASSGGTTGAGGLRPVTETVEKKQMQMLYTTYGKIIHTWHPPTNKLPLGPPTLMTSLSEDDTRQLCIASASKADKSDSIVAQRDARHGYDTAAAQVRRAGYLASDYVVQPGADAWKEGKTQQFAVRPADAMLSDGQVVASKAVQS